MRISERGINLIKEFEGFKAKPYLDSVGTPTIGYGTTFYPSGKNVTLADPEITRQKAEECLRSYIEDITPSVVSQLPTGLNQNQIDACFSFVYNLGLGKFKGSTLLKKIKANHYDPAIRSEFEKWIHAGGKVLTGLQKRRAAEADLYFTI
jgi:lysozyme